MPYPYRYPAGGGPPAPIMDAIFSSRGRHRTIAAFVDTGADVTQIPLALAEELGLQRISDDALLRGVTDEEVEVSVFVANLQLGALHFPYIEVVAPNTDDVLIGRNILAQLIATFDGPSREFTLEEPPTAG